MESPAPGRGKRLLAPAAVRAILVGVFLAMVLSLFGEQGLQELSQRRALLRQLEAETSALRLDNERLRREVRRLQADPMAVEEIARRELGMIRPGELVFIIRDAQAPETR